MTDDEYTAALQLQSALQKLQMELESCPCGSEVHLDSKHNVKWSHWSMNLPTLWGIQLATEKYHNKWDVFINLSGDTQPVYTPNTVAHLLHQLPFNFVTSRSCETGLVPTNVYEFPTEWHKRKHYTNNDRDDPPVIRWNDTKGQPQSTQVEFYFGSQWVILQSDFVYYLATEWQRPDSFPRLFQAYLQKANKVMTDETFVPTVLMHVAPFNTTLPRVHEEDESVVYQPVADNGKKQSTFSTKDLPKIYTMRYERMDEHFPSPLRNYYPSHPRYEVVPDSNLTSPHVWGPYYLGIYDLADIAESGALFARKVSWRVDPNWALLLPVDTPQQIPRLQWPVAGLQVSAVPNWPKDKRALMKKAYERAKAEGARIPEKIKQEMEGDEDENKDAKLEPERPEREARKEHVSAGKNSASTKPESATHRELEML